MVALTQHETQEDFQSSSEPKKEIWTGYLTTRQSFSSVTLPSFQTLSTHRREIQEPMLHTLMILLTFGTTVLKILNVGTLSDSPVDQSGLTYSLFSLISHAPIPLPLWTSRNSTKLETHARIQWTHIQVY